MSVIFLLNPLSIVIAACFLGAFFWAVRTGQYEDTLTPSMRVLLDDAGRAALSSPRRGEAPELSGGLTHSRRGEDTAALPLSDTAKISKQIHS